MSTRQYRLLRNNKEQGPFSAEEIIQKDLKTYDLIWIDGKSAAWRYPGEIPELKQFAPLPGDKTEDSFSYPANNTVQQPAVKTQQKTVQAKPRYKVSAAWSRIQTVTAPVQKEPVASPKPNKYKKIIEPRHPAGFNPASLSWEEAWLDWEKEKTYVKPSIKNYTGIYPSPLPKKNDNDNSEEQQEKYAPKKSKQPSLNKASEFWVPTLALIIISSICYWLFHDNNSTAFASGKAPATIHAINKNQAAKADKKDIANPGNETAAQTVSTSHAKNRTVAYQQPVAANIVSSQENKTGQEEHPGSDKDEPQKKPVNQPEKNVVEKSAPVTRPATDSILNLSKQVSPIINSDSKEKTVAEVKAPEKKLQPKASDSYVNVPEYIEMKNGVASVKVQNVSDVDLDLVVIDVQYYDSSKSYRKGETFYLHNLKAGKRVTVKTPKDVNSLYAISKVSLVSSDAGNVYVVGDH